MSGKKPSFDLVRKPAKAHAKKHTPKAKRAVTARPKKTLRERRQAARNAAGVLVILLVALMLGAVVYGFWRTEVRVQSIETSGFSDEGNAITVAQTAMDGAYVGVFPRDSIFLYPEEEIRTALLDAFPALSAVSISRTSFNALTIEGTRRSTVFYWCGESADSFSVALSSCYEADAQGLVFAVAPAVEVSTGTTTVEKKEKEEERLRIYAPVQANAVAPYPLRAQVVGFEHLPNLLRFIHALRTLGIPVLSTSIVGDEAEIFITPRTRVRYVLGREEEAVLSAEAAFPTLNLLDDSIEYVDLRFSGKAYVKRYEE